MASVRSFCRFLDRRNIAHVPAVVAVRTPKLPHALPRPLAADEALAVVEDFPWAVPIGILLFTGSIAFLYAKTRRDAATPISMLQLSPTTWSWETGSGEMASMTKVLASPRRSRAHVS